MILLLFSFNVQSVYSFLYRVVVGSSKSKEVDIDCGFPQGEILAGVYYSMFTTPLGDISDNHLSVNRHSYADDNQRYIAFRMENKDTAIENLQSCLKEIKLWMTQNLLKLNEDKPS